MPRWREELSTDTSPIINADPHNGLLRWGWGDLHSWRLSGLDWTRPWLTWSNFECALLWAEGLATWPPEVPSSPTYSLWITNVWLFQKHNVVPQISCMQNFPWDLVLYYHFPYSLKPGAKGTKNGPLLLEVLIGDLGGSASLRLQPFYRLWEQRIWMDDTGTERLTQGNIHENHQYNGCVTCSEVKHGTIHWQKDNDWLAKPGTGSPPLPNAPSSFCNTHFSCFWERMRFIYI